MNTKNTTVAKPMFFKKAFSLDDIPEKNGGYQIQLKRRAKTNYLFYVLADSKREHVTWIYNASCKGFLSGRYFKDKQQALSDYLTRS